MKIHDLLDAQNTNHDDNDNYNNNNYIINSKLILPFLKVNIEKINELNNLRNKVEKSNSLINLQTDKLLITGFEGDEEDFKKCYKKIEPIKVNNLYYIEKQNLNKLLIKDGYLGPIKLTKIKEFNMTKRQKNKIMEKIKHLKNLKKSLSRNDNFYQIAKINANNDKLENNNNKLNYTNSLNTISSIININNMGYNNSTTNINNINNSISNNFYNNSLHSLKGSYFLYKNNSHRNLSVVNSIKNDNSLNVNNFITLRDFLTNTTNNLEEINEKLKLFIRKNDAIKNMNYNSYKKNNNKSKRETIKTFYKNRKNNYEVIHEVLDPLNKKGKDELLKKIKKDEGASIKNIWIKRSTANLISFGKSFQSLDDELFYRERKRIISEYPLLEKDANIPVPLQKKDDIMKKFHKINLEKNSRLMKDLNYNNKRLVYDIQKKINKDIYYFKE